MARLKNYTRSLASGYLLLGVNIAYSLAMVPLALSYLDKPVFGIWAVVVQLGIFLELTDLGLTGAFARILIEYKDSPEAGAYASLVKTMWTVFCLQGAAVAATGWIAAPWIGRGFGVEATLLPEFASFLRVYLLMFGFNLAVKVFPQLLYAHQRNDLINLGAMVGFGVAFVGLWSAFHLGLGLWAMAVGYGGMILSTAALNLMMAIKQQFVPPNLLQAVWSKARFTEVFDYGKDRFLVAAGFSLLQSAPTFLVTRFLGLEAGATWSVGTRAYLLCAQLVSRISDLAYPAFAEMYVRQELPRLRERMAALLEVSWLAAGVLGVLLAFCNADFVDIWTRGRISWDSRMDPMLGAWLLITTLQRCFWLPVGASRTLGFMRLVYFAEALLMLGLCIGVLQWTRSLAGLLAGMLTASLLASVPYSIRRGAQILETRVHALLGRPGLSFLVTVLPLIAAGYFIGRWIELEGLAGLSLRAGLLVLTATGVLACQRGFRTVIREALARFANRG